MVVVNKTKSVHKKYYIISGLILLTLLVFVIIYESKGNYYTKSVEDAYALLFHSDINLDSGELQASAKDLLKVNVVLEGEENELKNHLTIRSENLMEKQFLKRLKQHKGDIAIVSEDLGLAAHAWVILTRKGFDNIKVKGINENETMKYTFEPDKEKPDTY